MLCWQTGVDGRHRGAEERQVLQDRDRLRAAVDELIGYENVVPLDLVESIVREWNVAEIHSHLDVVLLAAEREAVLELESLLRTDLVEAVSVSQARQVQRALNAVDVDSLRRI